MKKKILIEVIRVVISAIAAALGLSVVEGCASIPFIFI